MLLGGEPSSDSNSGSGDSNGKGAKVAYYDGRALGEFLNYFFLSGLVV